MPKRSKQLADEIEAHLFSELQEAVLRPEAVEYAIQEFELHLQSSLASLDKPDGNRETSGRRASGGLLHRGQLDAIKTGLSGAGC